MSELARHKSLSMNILSRELVLLTDLSQQFVRET
jgi:hypothetical protein